MDVAIVSTKFFLDTLSDRFRTNVAPMAKGNALVVSAKQSFSFCKLFFTFCEKCFAVCQNR